MCLFFNIELIGYRCIDSRQVKKFKLNIHKFIQHTQTSYL